MAGVFRAEKIKGSRYCVFKQRRVLLFTSAFDIARKGQKQTGHALKRTENSPVWRTLPLFPDGVLWRKSIRQRRILIEFAFKL